MLGLERSQKLNASYTSVVIVFMTNNTPLDISLETLANRNTKRWVFQFHCVLFPLCKNVISTSFINSFSPPDRYQWHQTWRGIHWKHWKHAQEEVCCKKYRGVTVIVIRNVELRQELTIEKRKKLELGKTYIPTCLRYQLTSRIRTSNIERRLVIPVRTVLVLFTLPIILGEWG